MAQPAPQAPPPYLPVPPYAAPPPPPKKSRKLLWIGIGIGIVVVIVIIAAVAFVASNTSNTKSVNITAVNYQFIGSSCSGWTDATGSGVQGSAGGQVTLTFSLTNTAPFGTCTAQSISTPTSGFTVVSSNTPLTVNAGATQTLTAVIGLPSQSYNGVLTIVVSVTTA